MHASNILIVVLYVADYALINTVAAHFLLLPKLFAVMTMCWMYYRDNSSSSSYRGSSSSSSSSSIHSDNSDSKMLNTLYL